MFIAKNSNNYYTNTLIIKESRFSKCDVCTAIKEGRERTLDTDVRKWLGEIMEKHIQLERYGISGVHVVGMFSVTKSLCLVFKLSTKATDFHDYKLLGKNVKSMLSIARRQRNILISISV